MAEFYAQLFNGLVLGLLFGVIALGFMLILGVMEVINFSHGALFALGAYFALTLQPYLGYWAALIIAPLVVGIIGLFIEWTAVRRIYGKDPLLGLLMTLGLAMVFEEIIRMVWGKIGYSLAAPAFVAGPIDMGFRSLKPTMGWEVLMPAFVIVVIGGIGSFWGAVIGGLIVGLSKSLSILVWPRMSELSMYFIMFVVLMLRPRGIMGEKSLLEQ
jgi:branched-subunit amino acid ABC-type transport system permease component